MNCPAFAVVGQFAAYVGRFLLDQLAHDLAIHTIRAPFAFTEQNLAIFPINRYHVHLYMAAPMRTNRIRCKGQLSLPRLLGKPLAAEILKADGDKGAQLILDMSECLLGAQQ